jgi:hypothetical protein
MYLYNHYYLKGCSFISDKLWHLEKFNFFSNIKELQLSVSFNSSKKNEIISFLFLNFLGFLNKKVNSNLNTMYKFSIYESIKVFLFVVNFIFIYLPSSLLVFQKVTYNMNSNLSGSLI